MKLSHVFLSIFVLFIGCGALLPPPPTELQSDCYNWPAEEFSKTNHAPFPNTLFSNGDPAIDFTLLDTNGQPHNLFSLLETKPVLLKVGSFT